MVGIPAKMAAECSDRAARLLLLLLLLLLRPCVVVKSSPEPNIAPVSIP
jgi:hypothetical protein